MTNGVRTTLVKAVNNYTMPQRAKDLVMSSHLLALCGVTAAGKNTVGNFLIDRANFAYVVSHTTRKPRENHGILEQSGKEYWFVSEEQMLELVQQRAFIEVKAVHGDTFYGTSIMAIGEAVKHGKRPLTEIDVQGTLEIAKEVPGFEPIFILPPSYEMWMERLGTRGFMSEGEKVRRMNSAKMELQAAIDNPVFQLIVNHEVELTAHEIIRGLDSSRESQGELRQLARELLEYIK